MRALAREAFVRLHRWVGLAIAVFLVVAGLTGSVIVFNHELDELLNPELYRVPARPAVASPLDLAARIDAEEPRRHVSYVPLAPEPGRSLVIGMRSDTNPLTGAPYDGSYYEVFVDPVSGERLGEREWGACCFARKQLVPFLYSIHYRLHLPEEWGMRAMGVVAIVWLLDSFVGFYLTLPVRRSRRAHQTASDGRRRSVVTASAGARTFWQRWKPAWRVKTDASVHRLNFDLHRASGLWLYPVLVALAVSGIYLALRVEVFRPAVALVADVSPDPFAEAATAATPPPGDGRAVSLPEIVAAAEREGRQRGWAAPFDVFHAPDFGLYGVGFGDHHQPGLGVPYLYFDATDGRVVGSSVPGQGTRADVFMQAMFPLHNGSLLGWPGRLAVAISGLLVAVLSVTGVVVWERKWRGRRALAARHRAATWQVPAGGPPVNVPSGRGGKGAGRTAGSLDPETL